MHKMKFILTFLFIASFSLAKSQDICLPDSTLKTDSLGNHKSKMAIPLIFKFNAESIRVYMKGNSEEDFMLFKILSCLECKWDKSLIEGKTSFSVSTVNEKAKEETAIFNIIYTKAGQKYIELLYDKSEERIFTIAH